MNVVCGICGGRVLMVTCDMATGSGHTWVLFSVCLDCREVYWIESGCEDCTEKEAAQ